MIAIQTQEKKTKDKMDGKYAGVNFLFLILITSGGFRLVLTEVLSLPYNVTQSVGTNVVFECPSDDISSSSYPPSWIKDRRRTVIYDAQTQELSDPNKYSVGNGSNTLTVMNVQLSDATMYCCNRRGLNDYCSNLVVIESLTASVNPSNGAEVGENFNLICSLTYNAPPMDVDYPFPLSQDQDPQLLMFIGTSEIPKEMTGEQVVGTDTVPHSKTLVFNRTAAKDDIGKNLTCMVSSTSPPLRNQTTMFIPVKVPTRHAEIRYPNGSRTRDGVYPVNSVFLCIGDGFPIPSVEWLNGNKSLNRNKGSVLWTAAEPGTYDLICSAWNELSQNTTYNATRVQVVNSGGNSGGFSQALNHTKSLRNVTQSVGSNVSIECRSESMNSTNQPSWFKYDNGTILIYNATSSSNSNSSKYSVETGNNTLTVMNVQLSDAATYCCNRGGLDDYCSNVVVIGYYTPSVKPSSRVEIGDNVTLRCTFNFNAPKSYLGDPFPLSDDQVPKLSMLFGKYKISVQDNNVKLFMVIGQEEMFQKLFQYPADVATVPSEKTIISINKTLVVADLDRNLECRVSSTQPWWYTATFTQIVSLDIDIIYPKRDWSFGGYKVNDVFGCAAQRFPFLNITWTDETKPGTPRLISTGIGNATAKILAAGTYRWRCTVYSPLKQYTSYSEFGFKALSDSEGNNGSAGVRNTLPILLTAACMLFTTFSIT